MIQTLWLIVSDEWDLSASWPAAPHSWFVPDFMVQMRRTPLSARGGLQSGTNGITYASGNSCGCCPLFATAYPKQAPTLEFKQLTEKLKHNWKLSGDTSESLWSGLTTADGSINFTLIIYVAETLTNFFHLWSVHRRETMPKMFVHLPSVSICNVLGPLAGITLNTFLFHSDWRFGVSCLYAMCVNSVCCIHLLLK